MEKRPNSIVNALESLLLCIKPSIDAHVMFYGDIVGMFIIHFSHLWDPFH